jgi:hypothetical protein
MCEGKGEEEVGDLRRGSTWRFRLERMRESGDGWQDLVREIVGENRRRFRGEPDMRVPPVRGRKGKRFGKGLMGRGGRFGAGPDWLLGSLLLSFFILSFILFCFLFFSLYLLHLISK